MLLFGASVGFISLLYLVCVFYFMSFFLFLLLLEGISHILRESATHLLSLMYGVLQFLNLMLCTYIRALPFFFGLSNVYVECD